MQLGTYWLVRVGIVMVLTGLVFFGNLAYHNCVSRLGAGGKLVLLYLASGLLLGAGWWWAATGSEGRVSQLHAGVFSGGWAALYFTTLRGPSRGGAPRHRSARLDGVLLLVCAAGWCGFPTTKIRR